MARLLCLVMATAIVGCSNSSQDKNGEPQPDSKSVVDRSSKPNEQLLGKVTPVSTQKLAELIGQLKSVDEGKSKEAVIALGRLGPAAADAVVPLFVSLKNKNVVIEIIE